MTINVAKTVGFCYGVSRAVDMCEQAAVEYDNCVTLGPIIHNAHIIDKMSKLGIRAAGDISEVTEGDTVIIRSHGADRHTFEVLASLGANVIDATCPVVQKIHNIVQKESEAGRLILVIGERNHPEVSAICGWCKQYDVFETVEELEDRLNSADSQPECPDLTQIPVAIVFQTTSLRSIYNNFVSIVNKEFTNAVIYDTVCNATYRRQVEAEEISKNADTVIVIGDKESSNSLKLAEICREHCKDVHFIQSADDLTPAMFSETRVAGILAGASTPAFIIKEVIARMEKELLSSQESEDSMEKTMDGITAEQEAPEALDAPETLPVPEETEPVPEEAAAFEADDTDDEEESFEALLEKSIKTFRTGDKVAGIVTSITGTEISLDLGTKQSGYIPISEFTDDDNTDINKIVKVGDTVEAFIVRVNDVEGMIMLSKKRLDAVKNWDIVMAAKESREIVQGLVIQENRGGIVVNVKGVHVFVPASQTGLSKNEPMSDLLKKTVKLRINEVNQSRRRVIGSIRDAQKDERREKAEKLWNEIEVGKKYDGIVKSMTSYGVFVDIGGVDGMIHISELSWTRIKQPSEVMSVGDEISVYVISFDKESRKISLGYKKGEDNPWTKFITDFAVDDVVKVKVVKMMPFGAFAEICPGVDGLIHISQIAEHRIGLPSEVLSEGQEIDVKITEIDKERKKVSLSMRALIEPSEEPEPEPEAEVEPEVEPAPEPEVEEESEATSEPEETN